MSKILMMNFRSRNLGAQEGSNIGSIQSHALRNIGGQGSSNLGSQLLDSVNNSLLVMDGDDSKNSKDDSSQKVLSGSLG